MNDMHEEGKGILKLILEQYKIRVWGGFVYMLLFRIGSNVTLS
jgi:hypothetical protein